MHYYLNYHKIKRKPSQKDIGACNIFELLKKGIDLKFFKTSLIIALAMVVGLVGSVNASGINENEAGVASSDIIGNGYLRVYGLGVQIGTPNSVEKDSYSGAGLQFENDFSNLVFEYGSNYTKGSAVLKYDVTNDFYIKGGLGYLKREMLILGVYTDVTQTTLGGSLGYGDEKSYNIEAGYLDSELKDAALADGHSKISYIEVVGKYTFAKYATFDVVGIAKNTNVFNKNYDDYQAELGWYATDDVRAFVGHDSVDHHKDDYAVRAGIQYTFATAEFSPYLRATANTDKNLAVGLEYSQGIANRSLKMRDFFENAVATSDIVAQVVAPDVFASKVAVQDNNPPPAADTQAPALTTTTGTVTDLGTPGTETVDYSAIVSDNVTVDANMVIVITTPNAEVTVSNTGASVTFVRASGGANNEVVGFKFVDEAGNQSVEFTQTINGLDTL